MCEQNTPPQKIKAENMWVKKIISPKSKGKKLEQNTSPQKIEEKSDLKKNTSPKSKGKTCVNKIIHFRKSKRKICEKKTSSPKSKGKKLGQNISRKKIKGDTLWGKKSPHQNQREKNCNKIFPLDFLRWVILFQFFSLRFWWGDFFYSHFSA